MCKSQNTTLQYLTFNTTKYFVNYCSYITNSVQNNHNIYSQTEIMSILNKFQQQTEQKNKKNNLKTPKHQEG